MAGKAMYKLEPVVADGGELIIYGPQVREISFVHGEAIAQDRLPRARLLREAVGSVCAGAEADPGALDECPGGIGTFEEGVEHPRITVTLATAIPERDLPRASISAIGTPVTIDIAALEGRTGQTRLVVENAGQDPVPSAT